MCVIKGTNRSTRTDRLDEKMDTYLTKGRIGNNMAYETTRTMTTFMINAIEATEVDREGDKKGMPDQ